MELISLLNQSRLLTFYIQNHIPLIPHLPLLLLVDYNLIFFTGFFDLTSRLPMLTPPPLYIPLPVLPLNLSLFLHPLHKLPILFLNYRPSLSLMQLLPHRSWSACVGSASSSPQ